MHNCISKHPFGELQYYKLVHKYDNFDKSTIWSDQMTISIDFSSS